MGRPAQFCKEKAIAIALDEFWSKGYGAVSVSELATAMSITRSSFYNCFKTREALFEEVLALYMHSAPDRALMSIGDDTPVVPAIRDALKAICRERAADPAARGCLLMNCLAQIDAAKMKNDGSAENDKQADRLIGIMQAKVNRLEILLSRAVREGEITLTSSTQVTAQLLVTHMVGISMISKIIRSEAELWAMTENFLHSIGLTAD